jgi:DNA repair and recombination protein RAD54B
VADSVAKVATFRSYNSAPILVTSYELLLRAEGEVGQIRWDLLVCDEAHRLKNSEIKTSCSLTNIPC